MNGIKSRKREAGEPYGEGRSFAKLLLGREEQKWCLKLPTKDCLSRSSKVDGDGGHC